MKKSKKSALGNMRNAADLHFVGVFIFFFFLFLGGIAMTKDANSETQSETKEKTDLEKEVEIAKQKQQLAEAKKAEAVALNAAEKAKLPETETKGLDGTVTVDKGAGYYSEILAYAAMEDCAGVIAKKLKPELAGGSLIILGQVDLAEEAALWNLLKIKSDYLAKALDHSIKTYPNDGMDYELSTNESPLMILGAASAVLGAAADIVAFFKTNRTITAREVTINEQALIAAVANKIRESNADLKISLPERNLSGAGELLTGINEIMTKRSRLLVIKENLNRRFKEVIETNAEDLTRLKTKKNVLNKRIDKAITDGNDAAVDKLLEKLQQIEVDMDRFGVYERNRSQVISRLDSEITAADKLVAAFTEKSANQLSPLERVATIEFIKKETDAKILYLSIVSQGGEIETSKTIFTQGRVSYLGGTIISYVLTGVDGKYLYSGNDNRIRTATFKRKKGTVSMKTKRAGSH